MKKGLHCTLILVGVLLTLLLAASCKPDVGMGTLQADITEFRDVSSSGDTLKLVVESVDEYTLTPLDTWFSANIDRAAARTRVTINVEPNFTDGERTGTLRVATSDAALDIAIHQKHGDVDRDAYVYQIPVIFHYIYNEADQQRLIAQNNEANNLPDFEPLSSARLQSMLERINRIYRGDPVLPTNQIERNNYEKDRGGYVRSNIEFVLATKDAEGQTLSPIGIKRYTIDERSLDPNVVMSDAAGGKYHSMAFPINQYINVFVYPFPQEIGSQSITLGVAHFPHAPTQYPLIGLEELNQSVAHFANYNHCISINARVLEPLVYSQLYRGIDEAYYTLAHELGHALGLRHTFAEREIDTATSMVDECLDSDYCSDTHSYNRVHYQRTRQPINPNSPFASYDGLRRRTACSGQAFTSTNVMDYEVSWTDRFSPEQVKRLRHVLYYSLDVPGKPKLSLSQTRSAAEDEAVVYAVPRMSYCRAPLR